MRSNASKQRCINFILQSFPHTMVSILLNFYSIFVILSSIYLIWSSLEMSFLSPSWLADFEYVPFDLIAPFIFNFISIHLYFKVCASSQYLCSLIVSIVDELESRRGRSIRRYSRIGTLLRSFASLKIDAARCSFALLLHGSWQRPFLSSAASFRRNSRPPC